MVTHARDGLEEGVRSTLSCHGCKFGGSANSRGQKERRGWGGQEASSEGEIHASRGMRVTRGMIFPKPFNEGEIRDTETGKTHLGHAGMLGDMWESR